MTTSHQNAIQLRDENGIAYGVRQVDNKPHVSAEQWLHDIAYGNITSTSAFSKDGFNFDVDAAWVDVVPWDVNYVWPSSGQQMEVISSSANDDGAPVGTGIRTLEVHYLDSNYEEQAETVVLNGLNSVSTTATNILRVNYMHTVTVGTLGLAAGDIDIQDVGGGGDIYNRIPANYNETHSTNWTVPEGYTAYINAWQVSAGKAANTFATVDLMATVEPDGNTLVTYFHVLESWVVSNQSIYIPISVPYVLPEHTDVKVRALGEAVNIFCAALYEGWLTET